MTQNGPDPPQIHPKRSKFFSNILYNSKHSLKGRCWGGNCLEGQKTAKTAIFSIVCITTARFVKYVLNTIQRIIQIRRMTHPCFKQCDVPRCSASQHVYLLLLHLFTCVKALFACSGKGPKKVTYARIGIYCLGSFKTRIHYVPVRYNCVS